MAVEYFSGPLKREMPNLRQSHYEGASAAWIMENLMNGTLDPRRAYDSVDGIIYGTNGDAKLVHGPSALLKLNKGSELHLDGIALSQDDYSYAHGRTLTHLKKNKYVGVVRTIEALLDNSIWRFLSGDDMDLLREFGDYLFSKAKITYDSPHGGMKISACKQIGRQPVLRNWRFNMQQFEIQGNRGVSEAWGNIVGVMEPIAGADTLSHGRNSAQTGAYFGEGYYYDDRPESDEKIERAKRAILAKPVVRTSKPQKPRGPPPFRFGVYDMGFSVYRGIVVRNKK